MRERERERERERRGEEKNIYVYVYTHDAQMTRAEMFQEFSTTFFGSSFLASYFLQNEEITSLNFKAKGSLRLRLWEVR